MPASSSLLLSVGSLVLSSLVAPAVAYPHVKRTGTQYSLVDSFDGSNFFDNFDFNTAPDPTNGFVTYVDQSTAQSSGLVNVTGSGSVYMGVDYQTVLNPTGGPGRNSVRVQSKKSYSQGLFLADIQHMPQSVCGVWPAFWTVGANWPAGGEIDIIEGVNLNSQNEMVLHTKGDCVITNTAMSGALTASQCSVADGTSGCTVKGSDNSFGTGFNNVSGGVYAMEWTEDHIQIWFFPRNAIPQSIQDGQPDPSTFGTPMGNFQGSCNMADEFLAQQFVFDTTFCGDWAGGIYGTSGCPMSNPSNSLESCENYVALNPTAYQAAYWEINSIKIYQASTDPPVSASASLGVSVSTPAATSTSVAASTSEAAANPPAATPSVAATSAAASAPASTPVPSSDVTVSASDVPIPDCSSAAESGAAASATPVVSSAPVLSNSSITAFIPPTATGASGAKETTTTVIVTSYVDICPTGFTTKTITHTATYCPADVTSGGPAPGFTTTVTVCTACAATPTTVTLTVPTTQVSATSTQAVVPPVTTPAGAGATFATTPTPTGAGSAPVVSAATSFSMVGAISSAAPVVSPAPVLSPSPSYPRYGSNGTAPGVYASSSAVPSFKPSTTAAGVPVGSSASPSAPLFTGAANKLTTGFSAMVGSVVLALLI